MINQVVIAIENSLRFTYAKDTYSAGGTLIMFSITGDNDGSRSPCMRLASVRMIPKYVNSSLGERHASETTRSTDPLSFKWQKWQHLKRRPSVDIVKDWNSLPINLSIALYSTAIDAATAPILWAEPNTFDSLPSDDASNRPSLVTNMMMNSSSVRVAGKCVDFTIAAEIAATVLDMLPALSIWN